MKPLHLTTLIACAVGAAAMATTAHAEPPRLHAQGRNIVDSDNHVVDLRGINLGGWLVEEMWMMPFQTHVATPGALNTPATTRAVRPANPLDIRDHTSLWRTLNGRLGADAVARIRTALRNAWLNESDFDRIHKVGFNVVRLPFLYSLLDEPDGIAWLDHAIDWADHRNMYVILDLHGAPGGQSTDHPTGEVNRNEFFKDHANIDKACTLWATLATRYKDRAAVAGYDLVNEPMGAPNPATIQLANDQMYRAIRGVDPTHLVFAEDGYKGVNSFPAPAAAGWANVALSTHHYDFQAKSIDEQTAKVDDLFKRLTALQAQFDVPLYVGEFNQEPFGTSDSMHALASQLTANHWAFSVWTYKVVMPRGNDSLWGLYTDRKRVELIDPFVDSEEEILRKLPQYRTENLQINNEIVRMMAP